MKPNFIRNAAAPCLVVLLAGCGGGDDSKERDLSASSLRENGVGLSISGSEESISARAGEPTQLALKIRNDGIKTAKNIRIPVLPTAFSVTQDDCSKKPLSPKASCELTIELYAEAAGFATLPLEIRYDYADKRDRVVSTSLSYAVAPSQWLSLAEWGQHNRDARHSGFVPVNLQPAWFKERWSTTAFTNRALNPASIGDGKVYLTPSRYAMTSPAIPLPLVSESSGTRHLSPEPRLYSIPKDQTLKALRLEDGSQAWSYIFQGSPDGEEVSYVNNILYVSPAAYAGGRIYVAASGIYGTNLWAFNTERGNIAFRSRMESQQDGKFSEPYPRRSFEPMVSDGKIYINGVPDGGIYEFDGSNGDHLWFFSLNQYMTWTPAVDNMYVYAYASPNPDDAKLSVINKSDGSIAFEIPDPGFPREIRDIGFNPKLDANNNIPFTMSVNNNILITMGSKNNVLVAAAGRLVSFDVENRRIGWQKKSDSTLYGQVSLAEGKVYAFNNGQVDILKGTSINRFSSAT